MQNRLPEIKRHQVCPICLSSMWMEGYACDYPLQPKGREKVKLKCPICSCTIRIWGVMGTQDLINRFHRHIRHYHPIIQTKCEEEE